MKKQSIKGLAFFAVAGSLVSSCDLLKDVDYTVTPSPLEMHADSVRVKVDVKIPEKGIKKKVSAEITPKLAGVPLKTVTIQGEKATANGTVIPYKPGGTMTYTDVIAYKPEFEYTELIVTGKVFKGGKEKTGKFEDKEIAKGTIITPYLVNKDFKCTYAKDEFKRVNEKTTAAQINYLKGKYDVRKTELKDADIVDLGTWLAAAQSNPKINIKSINITGYASPEGEVAFNDNLSTDRANSAKTATVDVAKKAKNEKASGEIYNLAGRGEDFDGFKVQLAKNTSIKQEDKDLILRVLQMYADPNQRETEMRNLGKSFTELDKNIFPLLRRAEISVVFDLTGYSDDELKAISVSDPQKLTLEELLFTATLTDDLNEKLRLYKEAEKKDPSDYRAANNVGVVLYNQGKVAEAKSQFEKANGLKDNPISKNNLGAVAGVSGDRKKAAELFAQAGSSEDVSYNKGIIAIQNGKYSEAVSAFGSKASFNKALAQLLNGDAAAAISTIDNSNDKESGQGYYLKAIAAARQSKLTDLVSNLKNAIGKDAAWKAKAAKDREFLKYAEDASLSFIK
ncbi:tetratricopeptide repeat protein [Fluviicola sp.]|uniref:tetratricopeptide repeat protein n=1 Tax=Fluviicola sp. TaxID=1917219 RepID=UPI0031DE2565